jgi:hypothetical protein
VLVALFPRGRPAPLFRPMFFGVILRLNPASDDLEAHVFKTSMDAWTLPPLEKLWERKLLTFDKSPLSHPLDLASNCTDRDSASGLRLRSIEGTHLLLLPPERQIARLRELLDRAELECSLQHRDHARKFIEKAELICKSLDAYCETHRDDETRMKQSVSHLAALLAGLEHRVNLS